MSTSDKDGGSTRDWSQEVYRTPLTPESLNSAFQTFKGAIDLPLTAGGQSPLKDQAEFLTRAYERSLTREPGAKGEFKLPVTYADLDARMDGFRSFIQGSDFTDKYKGDILQAVDLSLERAQAMAAQKRRI